MQEEIAVLEFFARSENLPLALSVAEQTDRIRERINTQFWVESMRHLETFIQTNKLPWRVNPTEDRNNPDNLVGFHFIHTKEQNLFLRPMMEQQDQGKGPQIYFGLIWSVPPEPEVLNSQPVKELQNLLSNYGFKSNESYLAWQWTQIFPRGKSFLLKYASNPENAMSNLDGTICKLMLASNDGVNLINSMSGSIKKHATISLDQLRRNHNK